MSTPHVIVIAGPNGAGKSTYAPVLLKEQFGLTKYVNADTIAAGLSAYDPDSVALQAGRLMLGQLKSLARDRESFAFETTLASRSFAPWLKKLKATGYQVHLVFLWLSSPEVAISRVADRVSLGGHHIPEEVIRRRYIGGLRNFWSLYWPFMNQIFVFNNTKPGHSDLVAIKESAGRVSIHDTDIWSQINEFKDD